MKAAVQKMLLYIPTAALGVWCMNLQRGILESGFDGKGLLIPGQPEVWLLWGATGAFLALVLLMLPLLGEKGTYEDNFPSCGLSAAVMTAAGLAMGFTGLNALVPGQMVQAAFAIAAGCAMVLCALCRMMGKKPFFLLDLLIAAFFTVRLVGSYQAWNADPQLQRYAFRLLAGLALMLFSLHRARLATGFMDRRKLVFMGFAGIFLCFAAMPGSESGLYWLSGGLWCAGGMCDLRRLEKPAAEPADDSAPEDA